MRRVRRRAWSTSERRELWRRWKAGAPLVEISRELGRAVPSVFGVVRSLGGIAPVERRRGERALKLAEREEISRGLAAGVSMRGIAKGLLRAPSTISREVRRHGGLGNYRAWEAEQRAWDRALRPKACKLAEQPRLQRAIAEKLSRNWSPQQISEWLERRYPRDETMRVSHETIYRSLFLQARGVLKKELLGHLRSQRQMRRPKKARETRSRIVDPIAISERPAEAADRAVPGHWEGDLLCGGRSSQIATLVERHSRFVMLVKITSKDSEYVAHALANKMRTLPTHLRRSVTWDRGSEMAAHKDFSVAADMKVYFCDPHSPWQRGSNENTNGLLRQYFPKGADLSNVTQRRLDAVARELNQRPRMTLGWDSPADTLQRSVASTG
jgi:transposase, IS30 family